MARALAGKHILLVEDEYFQAVELRHILETEDMRVSGPAHRVTAALDILAYEPVDAAILDIGLADEKCYPVADYLAQRGIPFLFLTGYNGPDLPKAYRNVTRISKPALAEHVLAGIDRLMQPQPC